MAGDQEQLVRQVTEQVLASIGKTVIAAPIHPPIGTCTGDYSKFEELRTQRAATSERAATVRERTQASPPPPNPLADARGSLLETLRGIVTARQLEGKKSVRLASCARLTPLAIDYIKAKGITVEQAIREGGVAGQIKDPPKAGAGRAQAPTTWFWWSDGFEPNVERATSQFRSFLKPIGGSGGSMADVIKKLAKRVRDGQAAGGILFVSTAARAACFANRCRSIRAVVGTCPDAVQQGIDLLGANVLIMEHPYQGWASMRDMVQRFIEAGRNVPADVERQLRELATCD